MTPSGSRFIVRRVALCRECGIPRTHHKRAKGEFYCPM